MRYMLVYLEEIVKIKKRNPAQQGFVILGDPPSQPNTDETPANIYQPSEPCRTSSKPAQHLKQAQQAHQAQTTPLPKSDQAVGRLVRVSLDGHPPYTPRLSTRWSTGDLRRTKVLLEI